MMPKSIHPHYGKGRIDLHQHLRRHPDKRIHQHLPRRRGFGPDARLRRGGRLDLNMVAALNTNFVKAKQNAVDQLGLNQNIEDILITLDKQIHLIRPREANRSIFIYLAM